MARSVDGDFRGIEFGLAVGLVLAAGCTRRGPDPTRPFHILESGRLGNALDLGVDGEPSRHDWVEFASGRLRLNYPSDLKAGWVTFLLGLDDARARLTEDFTGFATLQMLASGDWKAGELSVTFEGKLKGRFCALPSTDTERWFSIPLDYLEPTHGVKERAALWSPIELVVRSQGQALEIEISDILMIPAEAGATLRADEACPSDCVCSDDVCRAWCEGA